MQCIRIWPQDWRRCSDIEDDEEDGRKTAERQSLDIHLRPEPLIKRNAPKATKNIPSSRFSSPLNGSPQMPKSETAQGMTLSSPMTWMTPKRRNAIPSQPRAFNAFALC